MDKDEEKYKVSIVVPGNKIHSLSPEIQLRGQSILGRGGAKAEPAFPNHSIMHGAGHFGLTQLANVDKLPEAGAIVIATPLKIERGSGSPVRVIALVPAGR